MFDPILKDGLVLINWVSGAGILIGLAMFLLVRNKKELKNAGVYLAIASFVIFSLTGGTIDGRSDSAFAAICAERNGEVYNKICQKPNSEILITREEVRDRIAQDR